ncbi:unnamed protein product, partial [Urochloa humidicola]
DATLTREQLPPPAPSPSQRRLSPTSAAALSTSPPLPRARRTTTIRRALDLSAGRRWLGRVRDGGDLSGRDGGGLGLILLPIRHLRFVSSGTSISGRRGAVRGEVGHGSPRAPPPVPPLPTPGAPLLTRRFLRGRRPRLLPGRRCAGGPVAGPAQ